MKRRIAIAVLWVAVGLPNYPALKYDFLRDKPNHQWNQFDRIMTICFVSIGGPVGWLVRYGGASASW